MKKNKMMRLASFLLVAVLVSTSAISGTFAKYVTDGTATDSARVAKWGVKVAIDGANAFAEKYDDKAEVSGTKVVSIGAADADVDDSVLAPGTNGVLGTVKVSGKPEVMVDVKVDVDFDIANWVVPTDVKYFPVVIKVGTETVAYAIDADVADIEQAVEEAVIKAILADDVQIADGGENGRTATKRYDANNEFGSEDDVDVTVTWEWPFETGADKPAKDANNIKDTALGDAQTAATISYSCTVTVEQVN